MLDDSNNSEEEEVYEGIIKYLVDMSNAEAEK
jgi:hypothetical protein